MMEGSEGKGRGRRVGWRENKRIEGWEGGGERERERERDCFTHIHVGGESSSFIFHLLVRTL